MSDKQTYDEKHDQHPCYEIRLKGHLDDRWADRFYFKYCKKIGC